MNFFKFNHLMETNAFSSSKQRFRTGSGHARGMCGVVCCGTVWCGTVWCGVLWYGVGYVLRCVLRGAVCAICRVACVLYVV